MPFLHFSPVATMQLENVAFVVAASSPLGAVLSAKIRTQNTSLLMQPINMYAVVSIAYEFIVSSNWISIVFGANAWWASNCQQEVFRTFCRAYIDEMVVVKTVAVNNPNYSKKLIINRLCGRWNAIIDCHASISQNSHDIVDSILCMIWSRLTHWSKLKYHNETLSSENVRRVALISRAIFSFISATLTQSLIGSFSGKANLRFFESTTYIAHFGLKAEATKSSWGKNSLWANSLESIINRNNECAICNVHRIWFKSQNYGVIRSMESCVNQYEEVSFTCSYDACIFDAYDAKRDIYYQFSKGFYQYHQRKGCAYKLSVWNM